MVSYSSGVSIYQDLLHVSTLIFFRNRLVMVLSPKCVLETIAFS